LRRYLIPGPGTLLAAAVAVMAALSVYESYDLFFNLASGRYILTHGFPSADPFSLTASGPWFPHEWGFGALCWLSLTALGGAGPAILCAALLSVSVLLLWRLLIVSYGRAGLIPMVLLLLVLGAWMYTFQAQRAYLFGNGLFVLALLILQHARRGHQKLLWLFVPLLALWANLHGSWLVGPVLLASFGAGEALNNRALDGRALLPAGIALLSFAAAAASPGGFSTWAYPLGFLAKPAGGTIWEWSALDLANPSAKSLLAMTLLFVFAVGRQRSFDWRLGLPAAGLLIFTVLAERHGPMAAVLLGAASAEMLAGQQAEKGSRPTGPAVAALSMIDRGLKRWGAGGGLWLLVLLVTSGLAAWSRPVTLAERMDREVFPVESIQHLCNQEPGRVLNRYFLGGAISALCGPEYKVFIDGRNDLFPQQVHDDYEALVELRPGWSEILDEYDPDYLLWSRFNFGSPLLEVLEIRGGWVVHCEEPAGVLWVRSRTSE